LQICAIANERACQDRIVPGTGVATHHSRNFGAAEAARKRTRIVLANFLHEGHGAPEEPWRARAAIRVVGALTHS
jgi:hypothetical protein